MGITLPSKVADYRGQCIESVKVIGDELYIHCRRDKRFIMRGDRSGWRGLLNRWFRREIKDIPLCGMRTLVQIEYAQVLINKGKIEVEQLPFVASGSPVTNRYARLPDAQACAQRVEGQVIAVRLTTLTLNMFRIPQESYSG